jgi:CHAD domain-containing protein
VYRIESGERVAEAVRRIAVEEFARAREWLASVDRPFDLRIHETRQGMKRVRALTGLGREVFTDEGRAELDCAARDAGRVLSATRERAALLVALDDLSRRYADAFPDDQVGTVRAALHGPQAAEHESEARVVLARQIIDRAHAQAQRIEVKGEGWAALEPGFRATYRVARRALNAAKPGDAEHLHGFRTPAKRHLHHVRLLELSWPGPLGSLRQELSRLGDVLGDHHDLHLLAAEVRLRPELEAEAAALLPSARERLAELEREGLALGRRLFAEKPKAASRRFGAYFRAWR